MSGTQIRITKRHTFGLAASRRDLGPKRRACAAAILALALATVAGCARTGEQKWRDQAPIPVASAYVTSGTLKGEIPNYITINDPGEASNRSYFGFNDGLAAWVMRPIEAVYRFIFPHFLRDKFGNMERNLQWPGHLINNLLQGKYKFAGVETARFVVNSTIGILGLFDVATPMGMDAHPEDFGKTFAAWGSGPPNYFEVPFIGPTNGRDFGGWIPDRIFDPTTYLGGFFFTINDLSFHIDDYMRLRKMEKDPYVYTRDLSALARQIDVLGYQVTTTATARNPTLKAIFFGLKDPDFYYRSQERTIPIAGTARKVVYSLWLQKRPAPLIYFIPGTGGHRLSDSSVALAELAWERGYSAVLISNALNWEFMENSSSQAAPGYAPADAQDVYDALEAIQRDIQKRRPGRITSTGIAGLSLGGVHALWVSKIAADHPEGDLHFERTIAVNPPVDFKYAMNQLDAYYNSPLNWPADERYDRIRRTLLKATLLSDGKIDPAKPLPFDANESKYLIGLFFRLILRDAIFSSQSRVNLGVIKYPLHGDELDPAYQEIMRLSFNDYLDKILVPLETQPGGAAAGFTPDQLFAASDLHAIEPFLRSDSNVRIFVNEDDFLLRRGDMVWLRFVLGDRLTVDSEGGHLGNLYLPNIQSQIFGLFGDMSSSMPATERPAAAK